MLSLGEWHHVAPMVPADFITFFSVSAGASATLIGLLFIAISFQPARIFDSGARGSPDQGGQRLHRSG